MIRLIGSARRLCGGKREEGRGRTRARLPVRQGWRRLASPRWFCAEAKDAHVVHLGHALPAGPANCGSGVTGLTTGCGWALGRLRQVKCDGEPPWGLRCCPLLDGKKFSSVPRQGRENATPSDQADSMQPARTTKRMQPPPRGGVAFSLSSHRLAVFCVFSPNPAGM